MLHEQHVGHELVSLRVSNSQTLQLPHPYGPAKQGRMFEVIGAPGTNYNKVD